MNFEKPDLNRSPNESFNAENKLKNFEKIKTPEELLFFMEENIIYGYTGKNNKEVYTFDNPESKKKADTDFEKEYHLQSPEELLKSGHGVCWDQTELERYWFSKQKPGYNTKALIMFDENNPKEGINPHTFLAFEKDNKWFWFEHSFQDFRGTHAYEKLEDLVLDVVKNVLNYTKKKITAEDLRKVKVCEYGIPNFGSGPKEFVLPIIEKKPYDLMTKKEI